MLRTFRWRGVVVPQEENAYRSRAVTHQAPHPVRIVVTDDLRRSRLTVFFRAFLAIPHYFWALLLGHGGRVRVFVNWFIVLFKGRTPEGLHNFMAGYLRYMTHLEAYFLLAANPFPGFYLFDGQAVPGRPRDRPARAAEPLEDVLPALSRDPGDR